MIWLIIAVVVLSGATVWFVTALIKARKEVKELEKIQRKILKEKNENEKRKAKLETGDDTVDFDNSIDILQDLSADRS